MRYSGIGQHLKKWWLLPIAIALAVPVGVQGAAGGAEDERTGVTDSEVVIGSCAPLTGTLQERGHALQMGANAYFASVNEKGINGRKIKLVFNDDKYDPEAAITCFNNCLKEKVFAGAFFVGSAPISKYVRMADVVKLPMIGFCTGTPVVYDFHPTEFVVRPSYNDEVEKQIDELWTKHGIRKIAVIYQNDAFGAAIRESVVKNLKKYKASPVVEASYSRKTAEVEDAVKRVHEAAPEAVIIGATSAALKEIIKKRDEQKWKTMCCTFSVGTEYCEELGKASDGIILTQVVPMTDAKLPTAQLYNKLRKKYTPQANANMTAFEAFINAMVISEGLKRAGKDLTREKFVKALESLKDYDLGLGPDFRLTFSSTNHNGLSSKAVYYTWIKDGKLTQVSEKEITALVKAVKG